MSLQQWAGAQRLTLALVFTDIVGSTRIANRMGDEQWIQVVMRHANQARMFMKAFDCYEIKMIGDAFMVAFRTVDDALDFALAFQANTGDRLIKIRAGVHVGSVYLVDDDLYGKTVNYAARVVQAASLDWIVLSDNAKSDLDLARARSKHNAILRPTELGTNLKGFPPPNRLWRVLTQEVDRAEKARATELSQQRAETEPSRPRLKFAPIPSRESASKPQPVPDWWKALLDKPVSAENGTNLIGKLLRTEAEKKKSS